MKKVFRLANAEFGKIFLRPSIFILTALLIGSLVFSNLMYKPVTTISTQVVYENAQTVLDMNKAFTGTDKNVLNKTSIDNDLEDVYKSVNNEYTNLTKSDNVLSVLESKILKLKAYLPTDLKGELTKYSVSEINNKNLIKFLNEMKKEFSDFLIYMPSLKTETLNFYLTYSDYDKIYNNVKSIYDAFPKTFDEKGEKSYFTNFCNSLLENYSLEQSLSIVGKLKESTIEIDKTEYDSIVSTHYDNAKENLKNTYLSEITNFYNEKYESKEQQDLDKMQELILNYNSYEKMNASLLKNKFLLLKVGQKTDTEIKNYIGFSEISKYNISEQNLIYNYLIENNKFDYNYLTSFNFNTNSGGTTNAYDYTVYTMQILNILIIIFTVFYACSLIAGDQSTGTMKMIATRPYTKRKIFAGKYTASLMFGTMLLAIAFIASFVVGVISFGLPSMNCLVVFDAKTILTIHPAFMLLFYFLSCFINLVFYISLSMIICMIFKSNTLSVFLTSAIYGTQIILCGTVNKVWLKYTPFAHLDLFKYFGNSSFGLLKFNILPDVNFATSAIVIGLLIIVMNVISSFIFKTRDIT